MAPLVEFDLRFDGNAPGLSDHALSLSEFLEPLVLLMKAFKRAADSLSPEHGASRPEGLRRYGKLGKGLDLKLVKIEDGCVRLKFACEYIGVEPQGDLNVAEYATERIVEQLAAFGKPDAIDVPVSNSIKRFINSIPPTVIVQEYEGRVNGRVLGKASIGKLERETVRTKVLPRIELITGTISSVTFDASKEQVKIKTEERDSIRCLANAALVDVAVSLRNEKIAAQILSRKDSNLLLRLTKVSEPFKVIGPNDRSAHLFHRWGTLLSRLAE